MQTILPIRLSPPKFASSVPARQIGGTASIWAGRIVPFDFDPEFDKEWGDLPDFITPYYEDELNEVLSFYRQPGLLTENPGYHFKYDEEYVSTPANFTDASHIMGGTRYSSDKSRAVVDNKLCVIGIPNLHITGSSVFPTGGVENPTHLITSLSLYLADLISRSSHIPGTP